MNDEQKQKLLTDFPLLFPAPPECGWCVGEGWFEPIWNLSAEIEGINQELKEPIVCEQIKEKFGSLRFYISRSPSADLESMRRIFNLIDEATAACSQICKLCGADLTEPDADQTVMIGRMAGPVCLPCRNEKRK